MTFGAPMVGNAVTARAFEQDSAGRIFRYVDHEDPVPLLPTISLVANAYAHCRDEIRLQGPDSSAFAQALSRLGSTALEGVLSTSLMDEIWYLIQKRVDAHLIPNYQRRLQG